MGVHHQQGWGSRISGQRGRQALVPSLPSAFFLYSKQQCVTESFCLSWYKFTFTPSVADPGLLHTSYARLRRGNTMKKCQISSKLNILQLTRACMQRGKAALHVCAFVSAVSNAWNALEMCTAWRTIANHRSLLLLFPPNFPRSAGLADTLSNVLWLAVRGGLHTASYQCYTENCRSDRALELCSGVFPHLHPLQLAASSASL